MSAQTPPNPASVYIEVQHMLDEGLDFGPINGHQALQRLFHALGQSLRENANLRAQVASTRALLDEKDIEIFNQTVDFFNFTGKLPEIPEMEPSDD